MLQSTKLQRVRHDLVSLNSKNYATTDPGDKQTKRQEERAAELTCTPKNLLEQI